MGVLKLVREGADEIAAHHLGAAQLGRHAVEAAQQLAQLAAGGLVHPHGVVPAGDGLGRVQHLLQRPGRKAADKAGDRQRQQNGQQHGHPRRKRVLRRQDVRRQRRPHEQRQKPRQQIADRHAGDEPPAGGGEKLFHPPPHSRTAL